MITIYKFVILIIFKFYGRLIKTAFRGVSLNDQPFRLPRLPAVSSGGFRGKKTTITELFAQEPCTETRLKGARPHALHHPGKTQIDRRYRQKAFRVLEADKEGIGLSALARAVRRGEVRGRKAVGVRGAPFDTAADRVEGVAFLLPVL